jgi:hypothetical protein
MLAEIERESPSEIKGDAEANSGDGEDNGEGVSNRGGGVLIKSVCCVESESTVMNRLDKHVIAKSRRL